MFKIILDSEEDLDWLIDAARNHRPGGMGHIADALRNARDSTMEGESHVQFHAGQDMHGRKHELDVVLETGEHGTLGVRVVGSAAGLIIMPRTNREVFITTLRPDRMPPKEARS